MSKRSHGIERRSRTRTRRRQRGSSPRCASAGRRSRSTSAGSRAPIVTRCSRRRCPQRARRSSMRSPRRRSRSRRGSSRTTRRLPSISRAISPKSDRARKAKCESVNRDGRSGSSYFECFSDSWSCMRTTFVVGVLLGLAGVLAAARFVPWIAPDRVPSYTTVVSNGGRAETFVIRLPADRLAVAGGEEAGVRAFGAAAAELGSVLVEQFKVRDREGQVIGIAARHRDPAGAAWLLVVPGRGTMLLAGDAESARALDDALSSAGRRAGEAWSGEVRVVFPRPPSNGRILGGTHEFAGLEGTYTETWTITGVGEGGELRGTIELATVTLRRT